MKKFKYFILILSVVCSNLFASDSKPLPGVINIDVPDDFFDLPLEVYGIMISYNDNKIKIDSVLYVTYKTDSREIKQIKTLSFQELKKMKPEIIEKLRLRFPKDFNNLLKKFKVYKIERTVIDFSPQDTLPHPIKRRDGKIIYIKEPNYNKYLLLYFDKQFDPEEVSKAFLKLPYIHSASPEYPLKFFSGPNDPAFQDGYQYYLESWMMNFESAWDSIKGENSLVPFSIAIIDGDFTNCDTHPDLADNLNPYWPGTISAGGTKGHGTAVASVACAITNNNKLMTGAAWNLKFMPYAAKSSTQVVRALRDIKAKLDNSNTNDDCFVVNMSFGVSPSTDLENICNTLYNDYWVLLVAAVGDEGTENVVYPANYSSVIGVGASNSSDDGLYQYSNHGDDVELVATGESIIVLNDDDFNSVEQEWGTSFAAPFVSSLCALILSTEQGFYMHPYDIRLRMQSTADNIYDANLNKSFLRINAGRAIYDVITGIEDEVAIDSNSPRILTPYNNYTFTASFYDYPPTGNYIVGT